MADFTLKHSGEKINELLDKAGTALQEHQDISGKQDTLVSGKSIKTIIGESLLGEGDIADIARSSQVNEVESKVDSILGEDGYLYSNGEKIDMRFTRSLLPVGTSIPAKANLNTKEYLKIGKYYCSLNVDAKTITNCPTSEAFSMEVFNPLGTNVDDEDTREYTYRLRVLTAYKTGVQYIQYCATSGTAGSWTYNGWFVVPRTSFSLASSKNGGSAAKGASNRGVYIDSTGTFQQMGYTVAKSVPSNAVFTDTNTKVTAVENHYAPAEDTDAELSAPDGEVVVGIKRDAAGHVVGIDTQSFSSASSPDWNANDGDVGYIKNRTHYGIILKEYTRHSDMIDLDIWAAETDIQRFKLIATRGNSIGHFVITDSDAEKEFIVAFNGGLGVYQLSVMWDGASYVSIRYADGREIDDELWEDITTNLYGLWVEKSLDDAYIPDTVARVDYVENAIASAITNVLNTPV